MGEGRLVAHNKKGQYRERASIQPGIYHIYTGLYLENFWMVMGGGGKGDWSVTLKRDNIERELVYYQVYTI